MHAPGERDPVTDSPLKRLLTLGQSPWLDFIRRGLLKSGERLLVDCGLFPGLKRLRERNWRTLPIDLSRLDAVLLTHARLDHTVHLQQEDARYADRIGFLKHDPALPPDADPSEAPARVLQRDGDAIRLRDSRA